jgi:hypothetical protein
MVQSPTRTMPAPPSKVRRTLVKSLGPASRWAPNNNSCRLPRSVTLAWSPRGIMMSASSTHAHHSVLPASKGCTRCCA